MRTPTRLEHFSVDAFLPNRSLENLEDPIPPSDVSAVISAFSPHYSTLETFKLERAQNSFVPGLAGVDLSPFTKLRRFEVPCQLTGCNANEAANLLAPQLEEFRWVCCHSDFSQEHANFCSSDSLYCCDPPTAVTTYLSQVCNTVPDG
jgi:hypothetical protein